MQLWPIDGDSVKQSRDNRRLFVAPLEGATQEIRERKNSARNFRRVSVLIFGGHVHVIELVTDRRGVFCLVIRGSRVKSGDTW